MHKFLIFTYLEERMTHCEISFNSDGKSEVDRSCETDVSSGKKVRNHSKEEMRTNDGGIEMRQAEQGDADENVGKVEECE